MGEQARNRARIARRKAEYQTPGTIQYMRAHRQPRPRRWMLRLKPKVFERLWAALMGGKRVAIHRKDTGEGVGHAN